MLAHEIASLLVARWASNEEMPWLAAKGAYSGHHDFKPIEKNLGRKWQALCTQNPQHLSSPPLLLHVQACFAVQLPVIVAVLKPASHLFPVRLYDTLACTLIGKHH
jgi:hypothetical protein